MRLKRRGECCCWALATWLGELKMGELTWSVEGEGAAALGV